jgi:hypothetical protein
MSAAPDDSPPAGPARTWFFARFGRENPVEDAVVDAVSAVDTPTVLNTSPMKALASADGTGVTQSKGTGFFGRFRKAAVEDTDSSNVTKAPVLDSIAKLTPTDDVDTGEVTQVNKTGFFGRFKRQGPAEDAVAVDDIDVLDTPATTPDAVPAPLDEVGNAELKAEKGAGLFSRFKRQHTTEVDAPSPPPVDVVSQVTTSTPGPLLIRRSAPPRDGEVLSKLQSENDQLRRCCDELSMRSQLNQEMLQDCVTSTKTDVDNLTATNKKLSKQCEELGMKVAMDKNVFVRCTVALAQKNDETKALKLTIRVLQTRPVMSVSTENETLTLKSTIAKLSQDLTNLDEKYMRLQSFGYVTTPTANAINPLYRVAALSAENTALQDILTTKSVATRTPVLDYAMELNDLSDHLRATESDAKIYHAQLALMRPTFRVLKAELDSTPSAQRIKRWQPPACNRAARCGIWSARAMCWRRSWRRRRRARGSARSWWGSSRSSKNSWSRA